MAVIVEGNVLDVDRAPVSTCCGAGPRLRAQDGGEQFCACNASVLAPVAPECDDAIAPGMRSQMLPHLPAHLDEECRRGL
eukprot:4786143-Heterocapsa_arctica.AAC.1